MEIWLWFSEKKFYHNNSGEFLSNFFSHRFLSNLNFFWKSWIWNFKFCLACPDMLNPLFFLSKLQRCIIFWLCSDFRHKSNKKFVLGVGFFLQTNFDFLTSHFWHNFLSFESYCCPELKFEKIFYLWSFSVKLWGFKDCHFDQFGTINSRYVSRY